MNTGTTLVIKYPHGATQVVKPGPQFKGDWSSLAQAIGGPYFPVGYKITYEVK